MPSSFSAANVSKNLALYTGSQKTRRFCFNGELQCYEKYASTVKLSQKISPLKNRESKTDAAKMWGIAFF
jgi:hypothetical protein